MIGIGNTIIVLGVLWIGISFVSFIQTIKLNNCIKEFEKYGLVYFGKNSNFLLTRFLVIVCIEETGIITHASIMRTAFFMIPAKQKPFEEIISINIESLDTVLNGFDKVLQKALKSLVTNYHQHTAP